MGEQGLALQPCGSPPPTPTLLCPDGEKNPVHGHHRIYIDPKGQHHPGVEERRPVEHLPTCQEVAARDRTQ